MTPDEDSDRGVSPSAWRFAMARQAHVVVDAAAYFDTHFMSWAVSGFAPGGLIQAGPDFAPTTLDALWTCDSSNNPAVGLGQLAVGLDEAFDGRVVVGHGSGDRKAHV